MEQISQPWPWYITGPLIGLTLPLLLILLNKSFGISSTLRDICAMCLPGTKIKYFQYDWKSQWWNLLFAIGVITGSALVMLFFPNPEVADISEGTITRLKSFGIHDFSGLVPKEIFNWSTLTSPVTLIMICIGGFLIGFGTRYAGGCTSGHAIMGLSMFKLSSLIAVIGFFIGGLIVTWLILPQILKLL
ncbi:MAG: putative membrane protein YedE/YeeE [Bacteroidia bacterium]|jgi:uncharacterized membrane protein YedE/YeeE